MNKSIKELERFYYITNHPLKDVYAQLVDFETENDELSFENDELNERMNWDDWK
jgi:regulator of replication initiation timing